MVKPMFRLEMVRFSDVLPHGTVAELPKQALPSKYTKHVLVVKDIKSLLLGSSVTELTPSFDKGDLSGCELSIESMRA